MLANLKVIYEMLDGVNQSSFDKEDKLRTYLKDPIFGKTLRKVLEYMIDNKYIFSVKKIKYCVYFDDKLAAENQNVDGIFEMLDYISGKTTGISDEEVSFLEKISSPDVETTEVVMRILNKQTGCGLTNDIVMSILKEV